MAHQTVVETPEFLRRAADIGLTDKDREDLVSHLALNPEAGVSLGGGLRKVRMARQGGASAGEARGGAEAISKSSATRSSFASV